MVQLCHVNTANFPPLGKVYSLFFDISVPNISASPDLSFELKGNFKVNCLKLIEENVSNLLGWYILMLFQYAVR